MQYLSSATLAARGAAVAGLRVPGRREGVASLQFRADVSHMCWGVAKFLGFKPSNACGGLLQYHSSGSPTVC